MLAKPGRELGPAIVVEGHERAVECGVPKGGKEKTIVHVKPFGIAVTFAPGYDVRSAQQGRVGNAGQRATPLPVIHQAVAKDVLPDPLHDQPFGLRRARQICSAPLELPQRRIGQTDAQFVDAM